jgi:hypothetical protein
LAVKPAWETHCGELHIILRDGTEVTVWSAVVSKPLSPRNIGLPVNVVQEATYICDLSTLTVLKSENGRTVPLPPICAEPIDSHDWFYEHGYVRQQAPY